MDITDLQTLRTTLIDFGVFITAIAVLSGNKKLDGVFDIVIFSLLILMNGVLMSSSIASDVFGGHLANITLLFAFAFCYSAINKLLLTKPNMKPIYQLLASYIVLIAMYFLVDLPTILRIFYSITLMIYICISSISLLIKNSGQRITGPSSYYLIAVFSLLIIFLGFRLFVFLFSEYVPETLNSISVLVLSNLFLFLSFGLLLLTFEVISKKLIHISEKDFLAGINNRRGFFKQLENKTNTSCDSYILAIMDVDYFKKVNDTYGHEGGDFVIKYISDSLLAHTSEKDIIGRFGGEEFCLLLNNSNNQAIEKLEKIRYFFENHHAKYHTNDIAFTVSFGCVKTNLIFKELVSKLLLFADQALYKAKNTGRNRIVSFEQLLNA